MKYKINVVALFIILTKPFQKILCEVSDCIQHRHFMFQCDLWHLWPSGGVMINIKRSTITSSLWTSMKSCQHCMDLCWRTKQVSNQSYVHYALEGINDSQTVFCIWISKRQVMFWHKQRPWTNGLSDHTVPCRKFMYMYLKSSHSARKCFYALTLPEFYR